MLSNFIKKWGSKKLTLAVSDVINAFIAINITIWLTSEETVFSSFGSAKYIEKVAIFLIGFALIIPLFRYYQLYKNKYYVRMGEQLLLITKALLINSIIIILLMFILKTDDMLHESRRQIVIYFFTTFILITGTRVLLFRNILVGKIAGSNLHKFLSRRSIAIGAGGLGKFFAESLSIKNHYHIDLVGFLDDDISKKGSVLLNYKVLGTTAKLEQVIEDNDIDEIYITIQKIDNTSLLSLIEKCKLTNCNVNLVSNHFDIINVKWDDNEYHDLKVISISSKVSPLYSDKLKRIFDITASLILISILLIPSLIIALLIKFNSRGPVFYKTTVIGKNSKTFFWYKFRTMYDKNDSTVHVEHLKKLILENHANQKILKDMRVTTTGRLLRKFSLDELPQLLNVLKGDMSLVGPRPCLPYEYQIFKEWHKLRHKVIPGMTGLSQIIARNRKDVTFNDAVMLDLYYADNQSLWLDLKILFKTIPVVVFGKGGI